MSDIKAILSAQEVLRGVPSIGKGEKGDKGDTGDITPAAQAALTAAQQAAASAEAAAKRAEAADGDSSDRTVTFAQGAEYALPSSGETFGSIIGKTAGDIAILKSGLDSAYVLDRINPITSGSLNDYATPGIYTCTNSTLGENIADQPDGKPKSGFKVVVEYVGHPSMILQTITYQGSLLHTYKRLRDGEIWKPWYGGPSNQWAAIGKLDDLRTTEKGSLVGAINEVNTNLGNVSESGVYASGSTADPPIPLILDADLLGGQGPETYARQTDIETVSEAIPSPFRVRLVGNGRGALICPEDGIYLLLAGCRHDSAVYMEAIVSKHPNINGGAPKVTVLKSAGMSVEATNSGGTIAVIADSTEDSLIRMCSIQFGSIT